MIDIKKINVTSKYTVTSLFISFETEDTALNLSDFQFDLYRSNVQTEGYTLLYSDLTNFEYIDEDVNLFNIETNYYYKIKVTDKTTLEEKMSDVYGDYTTSTIGDDNFLDYSGTILHIHEMYLKRVIAKNKLLLLKKKRFGQVCDCYDNIRRRANSKNHITCFGTSYVGGYYSPVEVYVNYVSGKHAKNEELALTNVSEEERPIQFWTLNYPLVRVQDILIDQFNNRYEVTHYQPSYKNDYIIRQMLQMVMLPKSNIIYQFEV